MTDRAQREVRATYPATRTLEGAGVPIRRALPPPNGRYDLVDPFLLLDDVELSPGAGPSFPPHPHRGFEILTYLVTGGMSHEDSEGNKAGVGAGGLQHIVAGKGMWHGEEIDVAAGRCEESRCGSTCPAPRRGSTRAISWSMGQTCRSRATAPPPSAGLLETAARFALPGPRCIAT